MLAPDTTLQNRYLVINLLAEGGMGAVYKAKDHRLGNTVALKETFFNDDTLSRAFEREARLLASLRHPSLPKVSDHFSEESGQFLVMEFIPGDDLAALLERNGKPFPVSDVLGWADHLLDALDYLHTHEPPVVHRDIKPQNLKLTARGEIILLDFGLAKGAAGGMTSAGSNHSVFGYTPSYAPLEQIQGAGTDPRSDLYSLAATLYVLMTGITPPDALTRARAVLNGQPDPLAPANRVNSQVPPAVATVLTRAMSLNRDQRPLNAAVMRKALRQTMPPSLTLTGSAQANTETTIVAGAATEQNRAKRTSPPPARATRPDTRAQAEPAASQSSRMPYVVGALALLLVIGIAFAVRRGGDGGKPADTLPQAPAVSDPNQSAVEPKASGAKNTEYIVVREGEAQRNDAPAAGEAQQPATQQAEKPAAEPAPTTANNDSQPAATSPADSSAGGPKDTPTMEREGAHPQEGEGPPMPRPEDRPHGPRGRPWPPPPDPHRRPPPPDHLRRPPPH